MEKYDDLFELEFKNSDKSINRINFEKRVSDLCLRLNKTKEPNELRKIYTEVLLDDNSHNLLLYLSSEPCFFRDFPEFYIKNKYNEDVINCVQTSKYHRYGVFKHILVTIEEVGKNNRSFTNYERTILKWTMLLHDIGKPFVKEKNDKGLETFAGHDDRGVFLAKPILERFNFSKNDKNLILTLIAYHDKYLNEGEITYDNLKKLAEDLGNSRDNFNLLMAVKDADSSAKSIEVYNRYKITRSKYIDFLNDNFTEKMINYKESKEELKEENNEELSKAEYLKILDKVIKERTVECSYQPVINVEDKVIDGTEIFSNIRYTKNVDIAKLIDYAKKTDKYSALEQTLFINALKIYDQKLNKDTDVVFINMSLESYINYANKARIYEYMDKFKIAIDVNSYDGFDILKFEKMINLVHDHGGKICLDGYLPSKLSIESLKHVKCDYIKLDRSLIKDIDKNEKKQKIISDILVMAFSSDIKVVAVGVETAEEFNTLKRLDIKYIQGYYLARPNKEIITLSEDIMQTLNDKTNDSIV